MRRNFLHQRRRSLLSPTIILRSTTTTGSTNSITTVRVTLPNNTSILSLLDILVVETSSTSKADGNSPLGVRCSISRSGQCNCIGSVPVTECGNTANDVDVFAVGGGFLFVKSYGEGAGAAGCGGGCGGGGGGAGVVPVGVCGCGAGAGG
jgi:hypothetical protein